MKDMTELLKVSSSPTFIKLVYTLKVLDSIGKICGSSMLKICVGMQILRHSTIPQLVVVNADWCFWYLSVRVLLLFCISRLLADRLGRVPDFQ